MLYLQSKLNTEFIIKDGPRIERLELPEDALREALLNAIAHRDYFVHTGIIVEIFSDRVEITNPGGLVKGMTKKDLGKKSLARNSLLFGLMQRMNLVERIGSGVLRMRSAMKQYGTKGPKFEVDENWFTISFARSKAIYGDSKNLPRIVAKGLDDTQETTQETTQERILFLIRKNPIITRLQLAEQIGITSDGIKYHLNKLRKSGRISHKGATKKGYWVIEKS